MVDYIKEFLFMDGYGCYVLSAYIFVCIFLFLQWYVSWRPWRILKKNLLNKNNKTNHSL